MPGHSPSPFGRLGHAIAAHVRHRRDRAHLHELGDHTLRDIGLRRDQIDHAIRNPRR